MAVTGPAWEHIKKIIQANLKAQMSKLERQIPLGDDTFQMGHVNAEGTKAKLTSGIEIDVQPTNRTEEFAAIGMVTPSQGILLGSETQHLHMDSTGGNAQLWTCGIKWRQDKAFSEYWGQITGDVTPDNSARYYPNLLVIDKVIVRNTSTGIWASVPDNIVAYFEKLQYNFSQFISPTGLGNTSSAFSSTGVPNSVSVQLNFYDHPDSFRSSSSVLFQTIDLCYSGPYVQFSCEGKDLLLYMNSPSNSSVNISSYVGSDAPILSSNSTRSISPAFFSYVILKDINIISDSESGTSEGTLQYSEVIAGNKTFTEVPPTMTPLFFDGYVDSGSAGDGVTKSYVSTPMLFRNADGEVQLDLLFEATYNEEHSSFEFYPDPPEEAFFHHYRQFQTSFRGEYYVFLRDITRGGFIANSYNRDISGSIGNTPFAPRLRDFRGTVVEGKYRGIVPLYVEVSDNNVDTYWYIADPDTLAPGQLAVIYDRSVDPFTQVGISTCLVGDGLFIGYPQIRQALLDKSLTLSYNTTPTTYTGPTYSFNYSLIAPNLIRTGPYGPVFGITGLTSADSYPEITFRYTSSSNWVGMYNENPDSMIPPIIQSTPYKLTYSEDTLELVAKKVGRSISENRIKDAYTTDYIFLYNNTGMFPNFSTDLVTGVFNVVTTAYCDSVVRYGD